MIEKPRHMAGFFIIDYSGSAHWDAERCALAFHSRLGNVHFQLVFAKGISIEHADRLVGIGLGGHRDETKAFRHSAVTIFNDINRW